MNAMNANIFARLVAVGSTGLCLAGCSFLKPSGVSPRSFMLTPSPATPPSATAQSTNVAVGVGYVTVPGYLSGKPMAMRLQTNEVVYLETAGWAERLDVGLQRVLAADLGALIPTDRVRLSTWRAEDVSVSIHVAVERFDVSSHGEASLVAWWRVNAPGEDKVVASGKFSATRSGPSPDADPQGAVASMSALVADLARELAQAIQKHGS
jgi:uncharacterized lipoprotein YmbA